MQVTEVKLRRVLGEEGRMKAICSVTLDDELVIHDIRVIQGNNGLFVAMPSKKKSTGEFKDTVHPINVEMREKLEKSILAEYEKEENTNS